MSQERARAVFEVLLLTYHGVAVDAIRPGSETMGQELVGICENVAGFWRQYKAAGGAGDEGGTIHIDAPKPMKGGDALTT